MKNKNICIKNFIFGLILIGIIIYFSNDISKAYGDEKKIDYSRYYYMQLSDEAKFIYDAIYDNVDKTKSGDYVIERALTQDIFNSLKKDGNSIVQSAMDAFDRDHPEVFWLDVTKIQIKFKSSMIMFIPVSNEENASYLIDEYINYDDPQKEVNADCEIMESVLDDIAKHTSNMDFYDKIKYIHDHLVLINDYNLDSDNASSIAYKSISAIKGNIDNSSSPVCEGYSRAFKVICDNLSIPCVIVSGKGLVNNEDIGHMWNYVMSDDKWYGIDVTWDDPIITSGTFEDLPEEAKYEYFLIGKEKEATTHIPINIFTNKEGYDKEFSYPNIYPLNYGDKTKLYSITLTKYSNGIIKTDVDNSYVRPGTLVTINIDVKEGMKLIEGSVKVNGVVINDMTFVMPEDDVIITAAFITDIQEDNTPENDKEDNNSQDDDKHDSTLQPEDDNKDEDKLEDNNKDDETQKPDNEENTKEPNKEDTDTEDNNKENTPTTKNPEKDNEEKDKIPVTKKPITTKKPSDKDSIENPDNKPKPDNDSENSESLLPDNIETNPETTKKPNSTKEPDETKKPSSTKEPDTTKNPNSNKEPNTTKEPDVNDKVTTEDDDKSEVILVEDNFDVINPLENILIVNKATIAMSNKDVVYDYKPLLNDKKITFFISDASLNEEEIKNIVSKEYLVKSNSTIESLQVIVYNNEENKMVDFINKDTPLTIFVPVDSSWVNKDYEEYFYLIKDGEPERKTIMVRESNGQYYLQLTLEEAKTNYAIIRRRVGEFEIPGTTNRNTDINVNIADSNKETMMINTKVLVLVGLSFIAVILTIKVVNMQHRYNKKTEENE